MKRLILIFAIIGIGAIDALAQSYTLRAPRYLGKRSSDPATCSVLAPTWYWNTVTNAFKYCSATNTFSGFGGGTTTMGTTPTDATAGSVFFAGTAGVFQQDNANFFWNDADDLLRLGTDADGQMKLGVYPGNANYSGVWFGQATPSASNWSIRGTSFASAETLDLAIPNNSTAELNFYSGGFKFLNFNASTFTMGYGATRRASTTLNISSQAEATYVPLRLDLSASQTADAFQVFASDGTTKLFNVDSTGNITIPNGSFFGASGLKFAGGPWIYNSSAIVLSYSSNNEFAVSTNTAAIGRDMHFGWTSTVGVLAALDTGLARHAAGIIRVTDGSTGIKGFLGGGAAVASAAALPLPTGNVFHVTGTTNITSFTMTNFQSGVCFTMIFDDVLTVTDGNNIKIAGNFVTTADDSLTGCYDGTNFYETARAVN